MRIVLTLARTGFQRCVERREWALHLGECAGSGSHRTEVLQCLTSGVHNDQGRDWPGQVHEQGAD